MFKFPMCHLGLTMVLSFLSMARYQHPRNVSGISSLRSINNTGKNLGLITARNLTVLGTPENIPLVKYYIAPRRRRHVYEWSLKFDQNIEDDHRKARDRKIFSNVRFTRKYFQDCIIERKNYYCLKKLHRWVPDWREIRDILMKNSTTHGPRIERAIQVILPPIWVKKYICSVDESIYDICRIHDCNIELAYPESSQVCSGFILSGSQAAIKEILTILTNDVPHIKTTHPSAVRDSVRYVQSEHRRPRIPAHMVPIPEKWTYNSLLEYVEDLTSFDPTFHLLRFVPSPLKSIKTNYCIIVINIIHKLIENPITRSVFSRKAVHTAMKYFVRKDRFNLVRELFLKMDYIGVQCNTETFNIMLHGSALKEDLHNFNFILHFMLRSGHKPNGETWATFMKALPDHIIRKNLYAKMKEKGLLSHPKTLQITVENLIEHALELSLYQGQDHHGFIAKMNEEYGSKWLSVEAANRALALFGKYCLTYRTFQFLEYMEECFQFPDECSINTLLHSCTLSPNPWLAIFNLMNIPKFRAVLKPGPETCRILIKLAWITKSSNMAKLIWRYACLSASTSMTIRLRVSRGLRNALSTSAIETPKNWLGATGAILMGPVEQKHPMQSDLEPHTTLNKTGPVVPVPTFSFLETIEKDITDRINLDLQVFRDWRPCKPFGQTVWIAMKRDMKWKANDVLEHKDLNWLVHDSESIRMCKKTGSHKCIIWK